MPSQTGNTEALAQLVRALDCGSKGRGFDPHMPPSVKKKSTRLGAFLFLCLSYLLFWKEQFDSSTNIFCTLDAEIALYNTQQVFDDEIAQPVAFFTIYIGR